MQKSFDKIQYLFMVKVLKKVRIKALSLDIINIIYNKSKVNIILNGKKLTAFFSKIRNKTKTPILITLIEYSASNLSQSNKGREEIKRIKIGTKVN
jgi:hypothetical protein